MDRTAEFFNTVSVLKEHGGVAASPLVLLAAEVGSASKLPPPSLLAKGSAELARDVKRAARLVARLHKLAQLQGLFNDPGAEINELCGLLKGQLAALSSAVRALAEGAARESCGSGAAADAAAAGPGSSAEALFGPASPRAHWTAVAETLQAHVLSVTRHFQVALRARAATLADTSSRRRTFAHSTWVPAPLPTDSPMFSSGQEAQAEEQAAAASPAAALAQPAAAVPVYLRRRGGAGAGAGAGGGVGGASAAAAAAATAAGTGLGSRYGGSSIGSGSSSSSSRGSSGGLGAPSYAYSAQSLAVMHDARARASDARAVEGAIVELGTMFTKMSAIVAEQGDVLERIDADLVEASANVEAAQSELGKLYESVKGNRGFILKLFGVLAFVIVLFAAFKR
jgi:syntaxin 5